MIKKEGPIMAYTTHPVTGDLICVKRDVPGYFLTSYNHPNTPDVNRALADQFNAKLGVTPKEEAKMVAESMRGLTYGP